MTVKTQQKLDKATRALLGIGVLPKGYKQPDRPTPGERHKRFKMQVDRQGHGKIKEIEG